MEDEERGHATVTVLVAREVAADAEADAIACERFVRSFGWARHAENSSWRICGLDTTATSFDDSTTASCSSVPYGCNCLAGGTDGFMPAPTSGKAVLKVASGGVLTDPDADARSWLWTHYYYDGEGTLTANPSPDASRMPEATGRVCTNVRYQGLSFTPWDGTARRVPRTASISCTPPSRRTWPRFAHLSLNYLLYSCTNLAGVSNLGNLANALHALHIRIVPGPDGAELRGL